MIKTLISVSFSLLIMIFALAPLDAQISYGGEPYSFTHSMKSSVERVAVNPIDRQMLQQEDISRDAQGELYRVGISLPVNLSMDENGSWEDGENGSRIWRLNIISEGASAIGLYFSEFYIPEGGRLFVYNDDHSKVLGSYTFYNNPPTGIFAIEPVTGDDITLEYVEPAWAKNETSLRINELGYMYRGYKSTNRGSEYNTSEGCEVDAVCSEANNWRTQQRSVAKILVKFGNEFGFCTGSLVNNTQSDCFPYFLTADHCGEGASFDDFLQWIFYFKYERVNCNLTTESEPSYITISGSQKKAEGANSPGSKSDFLMVQLNSYVPSTAEAFFNGWRSTNVASATGVCIHHPAGDVKKISTYTSAITNYYNTHWNVGWASTSNGFGVTEGGSSGSPLFNSDGLVIGTLTGGLSACTVGGAGAGTGPNQKDIYGKFSYHWASNGTLPASRLKDWLDPNGLNPATWSGRENNCENYPVVADFYVVNNVIPINTSVNFKNLTLFHPDHPCTYLWEFEGVAQSATSTIGSPIRTFNTNGIHEVKLTATSNGVSSTKSILMYVGNIGIDENIHTSFPIYPNPANDLITIDLSDIQQVTEIQITDMMGRVVYANNKELQVKMEIAVDQLSSGLYQVQVKGAGKSFTSKFSIIR